MSSKEPARLSKGKEFHRRVQREWHAEAEGEVEDEKTVTKPSGRKGRIDILVDDDKDTAGLVEIKHTDWDAMTGEAVRRNVRRQAKQVRDYILSRPGDGDGTCPGVVFPRKPGDPSRLMLVESLFEDEGIAVVWHDETVSERKARG